MMKVCPSCGRDSMRNMKGTNHLACERCNVMLVHEGNGYVLEML